MTPPHRTALVTGAAGFIGSHLARYLRGQGYFVVATDIVSPTFFTPSDFCDWFFLHDLREPLAPEAFPFGDKIEEIYHLAADMGGIGYITANHADLTRNNLLIDSNMLHLATHTSVERYFYSSSACVYPQERQAGSDSPPLREFEVLPANPEPGYGWAKLMGEELARYHTTDFGIPTRIARFHNVYGPRGTFDGGKEKAPAALCRKIALLPDYGGQIEVWGDGEQRRSFLYIDDCVRGIYDIMQADWAGPLNLGTDVAVSINQLVEFIAEIANKTVKVKHIDGPQGVRGRNSDNGRLYTETKWRPDVTLYEGLQNTYAWIRDQVSG